MNRRLVLAGLEAALLLVVAFGIRLSQHHVALLYPDGYQYLLMARGISEHLQPTTTLGPGGEQFVPSADAGVKPLFPVLVAGVHTLGVSWLDAARFVTAVAGATAVVALSLLVSQLSRSRLAGVAAGLLLLASPSAGFWSGFSGPDPLAQALVLTAALAFVHRRPRAGGVLTGLALLARPEVVLLALGAALVSLRHEESRRDLTRAAPAAVVTASLGFLLLRSPVTVGDERLLWVAPLVLAVAALVAFVPRALLRPIGIAGFGAVALALLGTSGPLELWHDDWPLLVVGAAGFLLLLRDDRGSALAVLALGAVVLLGAVYLVKNPTLGRYFSLLLPAAAIIAGLAAASLPRIVKPLAFGAIAVAVVAGFLHPVPGSRDYDMFAAVATRVDPRLESKALVTAAPDAYGFWLPTRTVQRMHPGARGAVLLDAAQRLYEPGLTAEGRIVARVSGEIAFARPNGQIDAGPAVLVEGHVVVGDRNR
jgi:hypothetical protein